MIPPNNKPENIERFMGFADGYDDFRSSTPSVVIEILLHYLKHKPILVADIGCGPGLSTFLWTDLADKVIGIEPSTDMLKRANFNLQNKFHCPNVKFLQGYSNKTGLDSNSVDIVTCSQSFHWMEPASTLEEISRILVPGGIFAAYDYDWPPSFDWQIEQAWNEFTDTSDSILESLEDKKEGAMHWNKSQHLTNIQSSGKFRFTKEILFHNLEQCTAKRAFGLVLSLGTVQTILKKAPEKIEPHLKRFKLFLDEKMGTSPRDIYASYRMRLGIK